VSEWEDVRWIVVLGGIADMWLWGFDADGWRLRHGNPANGSLGVLPAEPGGQVATMDDAMWLADSLAFDHDAPVGVRPAVARSGAELQPKDPAAVPPYQPIEPFDGTLTSFYWESLSVSYDAVAELRFGDSYVIRYQVGSPPGTNFTERFAGREVALALYAMAARQPDLLAEYLCLYRVLEAADQENGKTFSAAELPDLLDHDYGALHMASTPAVGGTEFIDVFSVYKVRAKAELDSLTNAGVTNIGEHLYKIRNSIAHGKTDVLTGGHGHKFQAAARALPIVKLLARRAVEPT
jgi:hypothetical protein